MSPFFFSRIFNVSVAAVLLQSWWASAALAEEGVRATLSVPAFANLSQMPEYDWLNEALADMLTTDIAATKKIAVVGRRQLKAILAEQSFSVSDLAEAEPRVRLGNLAGATVILTGSYTVIGDQIRIDAKLFDVERGDSLGAATVDGPLDDIFFLEKRLALECFSALGIKLTDEDKFRLFQLDSGNRQALEDNYRGVMALDRKSPAEAKVYFEKATKADPFYRGAKRNLEGLRQDVEGPSLFSAAKEELNRKKRQLETMKALISDFLRDLWVAKLAGPPSIITDTRDSTRASVTQKVSAHINEGAVGLFLKRMGEVAAGDATLCIPAVVFGQKQQNCFSVYRENRELLFKMLAPPEVRSNAGWLLSCQQMVLEGRGGVELKRQFCYFFSMCSGMTQQSKFELDQYGSGCYLSHSQAKSKVRFSSEGSEEFNQIVFSELPMSLLNDFTGVRIESQE